MSTLKIINHSELTQKQRKAIEKGEFETLFFKERNILKIKLKNKLKK